MGRRYRIICIMLKLQITRKKQLTTLSNIKFCLSTLHLAALGRSWLMVNNNSIKMWECTKYTCSRPNQCIMNKKICTIQATPDQVEWQQFRN